MIIANLCDFYRMSNIPLISNQFHFDDADFRKPTPENDSITQQGMNLTRDLMEMDDGGDG